VAYYIHARRQGKEKSSLAFLLLAWLCEETLRPSTYDRNIMLSEIHRVTCKGKHAVVGSILSSCRVRCCQNRRVLTIDRCFHTSRKPPQDSGPRTANYLLYSVSLEEIRALALKVDGIKLRATPISLSGPKASSRLCSVS
jgi:hypothetical protein